MTPRERAVEVVRREGFEGGGRLTDDITAAIEAAVAAETDACAQVVWQTLSPRLFSPAYRVADAMARAIRARIPRNGTVAAVADVPRETVS